MSTFPSRLASTVRINVEGVRIVEDEDQPRTGRDIQFPYHDEAISHIAVDIGGSLAKCVYFKRDTDGRGVRLNFTRFETTNIDALIDFLVVLVRKRRANQSAGRQESLAKSDGAGDERGRDRPPETPHRDRPETPRRTGDGGRIDDEICIMATGGGAYKFYERIKAQLGVEVYQEDEMQCLIVGLDFFINEIPGEVFTYSEEEPMMRVVSEPAQYPYLLVNIGSGVSMVKVSSPETFERIGGSSLGGGTLWGLLSLITGARSFDEMLDLSSQGDNSRVDMLVGDIYGQGYGKIGLKASTIASTFGKVFGLQKQHEASLRNKNTQQGSTARRRPQTESPNPSGYKTPESVDHSVPTRRTSTTEGSSTSADTDGWSHPSFDPTSTLALMGRDEESAFSPQDVSRSLLYAISNNIGQIAYLHAQKHGIEHIYFGGSFIRGHPQTMHTLSYAIRFWSKGIAQAYFLRHEGYLGAVGAFLLRHHTWQSDWRRNISRRGSMEHNETPRLGASFKSGAAWGAGGGGTSPAATNASASNIAGAGAETNGVRQPNLAGSSSRLAPSAAAAGGGGRMGRSYARAVTGGSAGTSGASGASGASSGAASVLSTMLAASNSTAVSSGANSESASVDSSPVLPRARLAQ